MSLPVNISLMNVDQFVARHQCMQVSSMFIKENSSNEFHHQGLFSEQIFGQIGSTDRLIRFGYIELNTQILHPIIYGYIIRLKALYGDIIAGKAYAVFDEKQKEFVAASQDTENAGTGYKFFIDRFKDLQFKKTNSLSQADKIDVIEKYKKSCIITKCLVMPAGLRDMNIDDGKPASDSINKLYASLINYSQAMPYTGSTSDIFDGVRFAIQKKVNEIYEFIYDMMQGKGGYFQRKYSSRSLALGTRNVISTADMNAASPDDPTYIKCDEVKVPLFECAKMFQPLVIYHMKRGFFLDVFNQSSDQVALIDPKTYALAYHPISQQEKNKFLSSDGIEKILSLFRDKEFRHKPVMVQDEDEKKYYLYMVYDNEDEISIFRSLSAFKSQLAAKHKIFDESKIRPLTYVELVYIATYTATFKKSATVTRYPAIETGSCVPCKVHLLSTNPSRCVHFYDMNQLETYLPQYPTTKGTFIDSCILHPSILKGLGADFDGNCVVGSSIVTIKYTKEWLNWVMIHDENSANIIKEKKVYEDKDYFYSKIRIDEFPHIGEYKLDKNNAKVYEVKPGCFVSSYDNDTIMRTYEPISAITVDDNCDVVNVKLRSNIIGVSPNESLAVFDYETGKMKRVTPKEAYEEKLVIPVMKHDSLPYGDYGTFDDGWFYGSMVSDGWVSSKYIGYTKLDNPTRNKVKKYLEDKLGLEHYHEYVDVNNTSKLGPSIKFHFSSNLAVEYMNVFDMYASDYHDAVTKQISKKFIYNGSKEFLYGILCGLLDGDGSISIVQKTNTITGDFRYSTSSIYLVDSIKELCYKLGIRVSVSITPARNWSKEAYTICFSYIDMINIINELHFTNEKNQQTIQILCDYTKPRDQRDIVPLTNDEKIYLMKLSKSSYHNLWLSGNVAMRSNLKKFISMISNDYKSLKERIMNEQIHWETIREISQDENQTVYDFLIDTTKVFQINNGVIVYDTISVNGILSKQANDQVYKYLDSIERYVHTNGSLMPRMTDLISMVLFNLSRKTLTQAKEK